MYILAIETTGPFGSVALVNKDNLIKEKTSKDEMNHLKDLLPMAERLLEEEGVSKKQLTHVAVSVGPGSFTGIRIGVATARALSQALGIPAVAVPTLKAFKYKESAKEAAARGEVVCAVLNARRGQVYGVVEGYMEPGPYMLTDVLETVKSAFKAGGDEEAVSADESGGKKVRFYGDGIDAYDNVIVETLAEAGMTLNKDFFFEEKESRYQNAGATGTMALVKAEEGLTVNYNDLHPEYMRKAEAEEKLAAGELPICKGPKQE